MWWYTYPYTKDTPPLPSLWGFQPSWSNPAPYPCKGVTIMANVMLGFTTAATNILGTISTTATGLSKTVNMLSNVIEVGEDMSRAWKDEQKLSTELARKQMVANATAKAMTKVTERQMELAKRMEDPAFAAVFKEVQANWDNL